ncbi:MAG: hypothetical protein V4581_15775 [Bacteroidota bacterium]
MNSDVAQLLSAEFEALRQEIVQAYEVSGMENTGNWGKSVAVQQLPNGFSIVADEYINGRGPGKAPPSAVIEQWIIKKGIAARLGSEISVSSLAFLIARKIARRGWKPKQGFEDIVGSIATPQRINSILDKAGALYVSGFTTEILKHLTPA